jgi:uncharacterized protein
MKDFIEYLVKSIVSKPDEASVVETDQEGNLNYLITVAEDDMGLIIGKEGKTIKSVRNLAKAKAIKDNVRIRIDIDEKYAKN